MKREEKKLAYREKHAEEAMLDICSKHMMLGANAVVKDGYRNGFDDGVKWADETMIDKAVNWLVHNMASGEYLGLYDTIIKPDFITKFKKAMKGEKP
jgi:hypothetical protein